MKVQNSQPKHLMRKLAKDYLPAPILERDKQGFMFPIAYWFRTDLFPLISNVLTNSHFVKRAVQKREHPTLLSEHRSNRHDHHVRLWMLLNLELWHQMYIQGVDRTPSPKTYRNYAFPNSTFGRWYAIYRYYRQFTGR
jgi:asparagine synthase (glutamine-hydrolysing)